MTASMGPASVTCGAYTAAFQALASELDELNARRERLVKASRDTTQASKKLIFALHRAPRPGAPGRNAAIAAARSEAARLRDMIAKRIAAEVEDNDCFERLHRAFSPGLQEYVEAVLLLGYMAEGELVSRETMEQELQAACVAANVAFPMRVDAGDYVLGVADLTGELMRLAVGAAANGDTDTPFHVRQFLQPLMTCFEDLLTRGYSPNLRDLPGKVIVFRQSLGKVERTCYDITMRRAEFGASASVSGALDQMQEDRRGDDGGDTGNAGSRPDADESGEGRNGRRMSDVDSTVAGGPGGDTAGPAADGYHHKSRRNAQATSGISPQEMAVEGLVMNSGAGDEPAVVVSRKHSLPCEFPPGKRLKQ